MALHEPRKLYTGNSEAVVNDKLEKIVVLGGLVDEKALITVPRSVVIARKEGNIVPPHRFMASTELQTGVTLGKEGLEKLSAVSTLADSHSRAPL